MINTDVAAHFGESPTREEGRGILFIISAPSGAGKTTLCRAVRRRFKSLAYSVSYTTRPPRKDERDGVDYFFIDKREFEDGIRSGRWAEWARVHGHYYGTSARWVQDTLARGRSILLDIDVNGARQMISRFPQAVTIFILPPSLEALERRLRKRGTDDEATIRVRMANAESELAQSTWYRHQLVNDDMAEAERELISLIRSHLTPDHESED